MKSTVFVAAGGMFLLIAGAVGLWRFAKAESSAARTSASAWHWQTVAVELPVSQKNFPPGAGVDAASSYCLICHSAEMVLLQPPLTQEEWRAEIMKMRSAYGAPVPDTEVDRLSQYLYGLNGHQ